MPKPGSTTARGYGADHKAVREHWRPTVEAGYAMCHATRCLEDEDGRGRAIPPGARWDLGHTEDRSAWTGPEHQRCNRADGGRRRTTAAGSLETRGPATPALAISLSGDGSEQLAAILAERGDPMAAMAQPWMVDLREIPDDASPPLAMSGPHPRAVCSYAWSGCTHLDGTLDTMAWLKRELKLKPRWWQSLAIRRQLEHDDAGDLVWRELVETGPRRIGKSTRLRGVALWRIDSADLIGETQLAMLVSKDLAVGKEIHRGAWRWAENRDPKWKVIRLGGAQEVEKPSDESRWLLRADTAVYGYDVGYGQVDESWAVDPTSITDGLEPAMLERLWPQLHLTSTAHVRASSLMRRRLIAALRDADPNVLLLFWGAPPGADLEDPETWRAASPHWTEQRRELIERKYLAAKAGEADPEVDDPDPVRGWAAQYLNVWPLLLTSSAAAGIFPRWGILGSDAPAKRKPAALGIAANLSGTHLTLAAASGGKRRHLKVVMRVPFEEHARLVKKAAKLQERHGCPIALDEKGPAATLVGDIEDAGANVDVYGLTEFIQACADTKKAVTDGTVWHSNDPLLNDNVRDATWRTVGDRQVFGRKGGDIDALEAVAWANYAADRSDPLDNIW
jgi:hypothetical protein